MAVHTLRVELVQASERRGVLIAFIILDNPAASLLDMRTVSFVDGKPAFAQVRRRLHRYLCSSRMHGDCTRVASHLCQHTCTGQRTGTCNLDETSMPGLHAVFLCLVQYLDTFPFPFYVVLRDIAALPATLADLLRQWFHLHAGQ